MGRQLTILVFLTMSLWAQDPLYAQEKSPAQLYREGVQAFGQDQYAQALEAFVAVYNLTTKPDLLYNIAICHQKLGDLPRAVAFYELYIEEKPDADDAVEIQKLIAELNKTLAAADASAEKEPKPKTTIRRSDVETIDLEDDSKPWYFGPALGYSGSGILLISGLFTSISAYSKYRGLEDSCAPSCSDDAVSEARALSIAADIQLGLGIVGAGLSTYFIIKKYRAHKAASPKTPTSAFNFNGTGISWRIHF